MKKREMTREITNGIPCVEISAGRITVPVIFIATPTSPAVCGHIATPKIQLYSSGDNDICGAARTTELYENKNPGEILSGHDIIELPQAGSTSNPGK